MANIKVYVDGSFNPVSKQVGSGAVILVDDEKVHEISAQAPESFIDKYHNVAGEILASIVSLQVVRERFWKPGDTVSVYYDYTGIEMWVTGRWSANNLLSKRYVSIVKELPFKVEFHKVKAHTGDRYNELADTLARKAVGLH